MRMLTISKPRRAPNVHSSEHTLYVLSMRMLMICRLRRAPHLCTILYMLLLTIGPCKDGEHAGICEIHQSQSSALVGLDDFTSRCLPR